MVNKKDFFIRIIDQAPDMKYRVDHSSDGDMVVHKKVESEWKDSTVMQGGITINGQLKKFYMSLNVWSAADYVHQWDDGLKRLEKHNQSCFVIDVDNSRGIPSGQWWILYKVDNQIYMQFHLFDDDADQAIMNGLFTPETCYDFISEPDIATDESERISELFVSYSDLFL